MRLQIIAMLTFSGLASAQSELLEDATIDANSSVVAGSDFGQSVSTNEQWLAVGAPQDGISLLGEVQLFERIGGTVFTPADSFDGLSPGGAYGAAVDLDLSSGVPRVLVGAPETDQPSQPRAGVAQLLELQGGNLVSIATLQVPTPVAQSTLGASVGLDGNLAAVGRPGDEEGDVRVWDLTGGGLLLLSPVAAFDGGTGDEFGKALALDGSVLAVGAPSHDLAGGVADAGAVYVYSQTAPLGPLNPLGLLLDSKLTAPAAGPFDEFGASVALEADLLAVGAPGRGISGEVLLFRRQGNAFVPEDTLVPSGLSPNARYGASVAIVDGRVHVGAPLAVPPGEVSSNGAAFVYRETSPGSGVWEVLYQLLAADGSGVDRVGTAIGAIGDVALAGAPAATALTNPLNPGTPVFNAGVVYAFDAGEQICITDFVGTSTPAFGDRFGSALDLEQETLLVGRPEDDENGSNAGTVSVFQQVGGSWSEAQLIEPLTRVFEGGFGESIDLDGNLLAVGAPATSGGSFQPGRAEVWSRLLPGQSFVREAELTAPASEPRDRFGTGVAAAADVIAVGAPGRDLDSGELVEFVKDEVTGDWEALQTIVRTVDADVSAMFGESMAGTDERLVVGSPGADLAGTDSGDLTLLERRRFAVYGATDLDAGATVFASAGASSAVFARTSVMRVPDYDGNGIDDLAIGDPTAVRAGGEGAVFITSLDASGAVVSVFPIDATLVPEVSLIPGDEFGTCVVPGNFDLDSDVELAVGCRRANGQTGAVVIVDIVPAVGPSSTPTVTGSWRIDSSVLPSVTPNCRFGTSIENIGDLDGNGIDDLLVGVSNFLTSPTVNGGAVATVLLGNPQSVLDAKLFGAVDLGFTEDLSDGFGSEVALLGDYGNRRLGLASSGNMKIGGDAVGAAITFELVQDSNPLVAGSLIGLERITDGEGGFQGPLFSANAFGSALSNAGDLDSDGVLEVLIADWTDFDLNDYIGVGQGVVGAIWIASIDSNGAWVGSEKLSGTQGNLGLYVGAGQEAGESVEWLGDFDDDGRSEIALARRFGSAPDFNSGVWILEVGPGWGLIDEKVVASAGQPGDRLGSAVAFDGLTVVAGAPGSDLGAPQGGAAVVFRVVDGQLLEQETLIADPPVAFAGFGSSLSLEGNRLIVGAAGGLDGLPGNGQSFIFERLDESSPFVQVELVQPEVAGQPGDRFGAAVALDGATAFVGAPDRDSGGFDAGTIFSVSLSGSQCPELLASSDFISVNQGGEQAFWYEVDPIYWDPAAPGFAPHLYLTLASTGLLPGPLPNGLTLFPDALFNLSLTGVNQAPFIDTFGSVAAPGVIESSFAFPAGTSPNLAGLRVFSSTVVFGFDLVVDEVSEVSSFEFVQ